MNQLVTPDTPCSTLSTTVISSGATTFKVQDTSLFTSTGLLLLVHNQGREIVSYSGTTSTSFTGITRGTNGTTARAWGFGTIISQTEWTSVLGASDTVTLKVPTTSDAYANASIEYLDEGVSISGKGLIQHINFTGEGIQAVVDPANTLTVNAESPVAMAFLLMGG